MKSYFVRNTEELRARGVPRRLIHAIQPSSRQTVEENAEVVRNQITAIGDEGRERLVIVAHSRGACDALTFALREPKFVQDRVQAIFLIQGAFGGTALADYVQGVGPRMDQRLPTRFRIVGHLLGKIEKILLRRGTHGGLPGLGREESRCYWEGLLKERADAIPIVGPKTFFIAAETKPSRLGMVWRALGRYLGTYDGPNDGIVAVRDQVLPGIGLCLGVFDCGHRDLTSRARRSRSIRRLQAGLVQSILMAVGKEELNPSAEIEQTKKEKAKRRSRGSLRSPLVLQEND